MSDNPGEMEETGGFPVPPEESSNRAFLLAALGLGGLFVLGLLLIGAYALVIAPRQRATREAQLATIAAQNTSVAVAVAQTAAAARNSPTPALPTSTLAATETPVVRPSNTPTWTPPGTSEQLTATAQATGAGGGPYPFPSPSVTTAPPTPSRTPSSTSDQLTATAQATSGVASTATTAPLTATSIFATRRALTQTAQAAGGGGGQTPTPTATPTGLGGIATSTRTATALVAPTSTPRPPTPTELPDTGFFDGAGGLPGLVLAGLLLVIIVVVARRLRLRIS